MDDGLHGIGVLARESGLSVSALRFYDTAGVLRPAWVDAATGYRWYTADQLTQARLVATLRQVRMPLEAICRVLLVVDRPDAAKQLLDQHLSRLEDGLSDARRHLDVAQDLIADQQWPTACMTVHHTDLAAGLGAVSYAISHDPELPALNGVLLDFDGATLRLVASDRYRLAVATIQTRQPRGPATRLIAPASLTEILPDDQQSLTVELTQRVAVGERELHAIDAVFPDYQRFLRTTPTESIRITTADLVERVSAGAVRTRHRQSDGQPHQVSVIRVVDDTIQVIDGDHIDAIGLNRDYLLQAISASGAQELALAFDSPIGPVAMWEPQHPADISLLMPVKLDRPPSEPFAHSQ